MALTTTSTSLVEFPTAPTLPIKLTTSNYPTWFKQMHHLLAANDTIGYIIGATPCPPATIATGDTVTANPTYSHWVRQDHYVFLALLGSCGPEAHVIMSSATSSADAWARLTKTYANRSRTRIMSLKERLASISKGSSAVSDYLRSIRFIAVELALIDHPVDDLDLVIATLNGLGPSFREFNASMRARDTPLSFDELYDKLVDFEIFLQREERHHQALPATANHAHRSSSNPHRGKRYARDFIFRTKAPTHTNPPFSSRRPLSPPASHRSASVPICQYCDHRGHTAKTCY